jgi:hypothetical protein
VRIPSYPIPVNFFFFFLSLRNGYVRETIGKWEKKKGGEEKKLKVIAHAQLAETPFCVCAFSTKVICSVASWGGATPQLNEKDKKKRICACLQRK